MGARLMEPIPPIQQFAPTIRADVAALVMRMLEREPTSRPTMAEVESEVRKLLGLPARQSGWHPAVIARGENATPSDPAGLSFGETAPGSHSSLQSTPDLPLSSDSQSAQLSTPSSEKAAGEISPRDIPVPQSLSSMPSVPLGRGENLRAGPEDRTVPPAPTHLVPEAVASPSAPTFPKPPQRASGYRLGAIGGVFVRLSLLPRPSPFDRGSAPIRRQRIHLQCQAQ